MNRRLVSFRCIVPIFVAVVVTALQPAAADWDPQQPAKWFQMPDLSPMGMDVQATFEHLLADDFPCNQTGPITNIHIWGSWKNEFYPNFDRASSAGFTLSIHADVSIDDPDNELGYSYPGEVLWYTNIQPGEYSVRIAGMGDEGWFDPVTDDFIFPGDSVCWQYNFSFDPAEAFVQMGTPMFGVIYWLDVQAHTVDPMVPFGWKTSMDDWNDDAVWGQGPEPYQGQWQELRYPAGHEMYPDSIDLAFVIVSGYEQEEEPEPEPDPGAKWIQEPDCMFGIDMPSYAVMPDQGAEPVTWYRVADDWLCDGRPIDSIRWWGSYPGWPSITPPEDPISGRPIGFILTWYTDIPADDPGNMMGYSMPGEPITSASLDLMDFAEMGPPVAGTVIETYYCTVSNKVDGPPEEHEYMYEARLMESWNEKEGNIYWLSVEAVFEYGYEPDPEGGIPEWGWKTSWETNLIDDAVVWTAREEEGGSPYPEWKELIWPEYPYPYLFFPPYTNYWIFTNPENGGPSMNMAFALFSDVQGRRTAKWRQMPDLIDGTDMWSWRYENGEPGSPFLRADDFISDGRRITDIHWWGSYSNWLVDIDGTEANPVLPPSGLERPIGFELSWHTNDPPCMPGEALTNVFVSIHDCHEVFYYSVWQWWLDEPVWEHEYQYYVDLVEIYGPWMEKTNGHYWLNIEAVFDDLFNPEQAEHGGWGWKITGPAAAIRECPSMVYDRQGGGWHVAVFPPDYIPERVGLEFDLAFELTTDEVTTNVPANTIVITNAYSTNFLGGDTIMSVGTSGVGMQYLQYTTNLMTGAWSNIMVKPAPHPVPLTNTWHRPGPLDNIDLYRIIEK